MIFGGKWQPTKILCSHRRRIETEGKAKVVTSVWGAEFVQFLAAQAVLHWSIWKKRSNSASLLKKLLNSIFLKISANFATCAHGACAAKFSFFLNQSDLKNEYLFFKWAKSVHFFEFLFLACKKTQIFPFYAGSQNILGNRKQEL